MAPKSTNKQCNLLHWFSCFSPSKHNRVSAEESIAEELQLATARVVSKEEDSNGVVRVKIVMSKVELKQMMEKMNNTEKKQQLRRQPASAQSLETMLHALRRKHAKKDHYKGDECRGWRPGLQTIHEEM